MKPVIHLFPNGQVERGTGRPGYKWVQAYSQAIPNGESMPLPRAEWLAMARRDGQRCVFHFTKEDARKAQEA